MSIGIGLPNTVPGTDGATMRDWAIRAEAAGFSTLGTIDRIVYPNHEPLVALSWAAAVTERIGLATSILLAPLRANTALLAKQAASLNVLSGGRLTLGMAVGGREDDFEVSGVDYTRRGAIFDRQLEDLDRLWSSGQVGFEQRPQVMIGGNVDASFRRASQHDGWFMGGGPPERFAATMPKLHEAWQAAGRDGEPRKMALGYFGLGDGAADWVHSYVTHYYGSDYGEQLAPTVPVTADAVKERVSAFVEAGCDELILFPTSNDLSQVDRLAAAVL